MGRGVGESGVDSIKIKRGLKLETLESGGDSLESGGDFIDSKRGLDLESSGDSLESSVDSNVESSGVSKNQTASLKADSNLESNLGVSKNAPADSNLRIQNAPADSKLRNQNAPADSNLRIQNARQNPANRHPVIAAFSSQFERHKVLAFFLIFFVASVGAMFVPETSGEQMREKIGTEIPNLEIFNYRFFHIKSDVLESVASGTLAHKFRQREELFSAEIKNVAASGMKQSFKAPHAVSQEGVYRFPKSVEFARSDGLFFSSQSGVYRHAQGVFQGAGSFEVKSQRLSANGLDINYDLKNKILKAKNITAVAR